MAALLRLYLIVTGIGAAVSVLMPSLVVVALFLIVPGLILAVMPTAFLWGCIFAAVWFTVRGRIGNVPATVVALAATAALLWIAPASSQRTSAARLDAAIRPDVTPPTPIALAGHLRLDMPAPEVEPYDPKHPDVPRPVRCNGLCAAALFTEGVETVTLNPISPWGNDEARAIGNGPLAASARTFRRVPRDRCTETLRPTDAAGFGASLDEVRALEAEWNLRLSTQDCIVAESTRTGHDMVIAQGTYTLFGQTGGYDWDLGPRGVAVHRLEIRAGTTVLLRRMIATTDALSRPLWIGAGGSLESFRFGWERKTLSNAPRYGTLPVQDLLRNQTNLAAHADPKTTARLVRDRLQAMLADPAVTATDPGWAAADIYFRALKPGTVTDEDRALLPALVRDRRMTRFDGIWDAVRGLGAEGILLRKPLVERVANPGPDNQDEAIRVLGQVIGRLPPGIFAQQTPAEQALLADPALRRRARGLVARQADRGRAAVPLLLEIVDYHAHAWAAQRLNPNRRSSHVDTADDVTVDAARIAFCELGPEGAEALPRLLAIDADPALNRPFSSDRDWMFALARLGQPVESFTKPQNLSGTTDQFHDNLRRRLQRFRADQNCRSNFT